MRITSPRDSRMHRSARVWLESHDRCGVPVDVVEDALADAAQLLERDLDTDEIDRVCRTTVRTHVHDREQAEAQTAIASTREEDRR